MSDGGWVKAHRARWQDPIFRTKQEAAVFAYMYDCARWARHELATQFGQVVLERGQLLVSERRLGEDFGLGKKHVAGLLKRLEAGARIDANRHHKASKAGTIITILNYDAEQSVNDVPSRAGNHSERGSGTKGAPLAHQGGTTRERREGNNTSKNETAAAAAAREEVWSEEVHEVAEEVRRLAELPETANDLSIVSDWLRDGIDREMVIYVAAERVGIQQRQRGAKTRWFKYLDDPVREIFARYHSGGAEEEQRRQDGAAQPEKHLRAVR